MHSCGLLLECIIEFSCACRPLITQVFDLEAEYEHIGDWNQRYQDHTRQQHYDDGMEFGMEGCFNRGLKFDMLSWKHEAAKRIVKSSGFTKLGYREVFPDLRTKCGAGVLYRRQV